MAQLSAINVQITGDVDDLVRAMAKGKRSTEDFSSSTRKHLREVEAAAKSMEGFFGKVVGGLANLKTLAVGAFAGWGLGQVAQGFVEVGSRMDTMRAALDTITQGRGEEWFKDLNQWALKMPINTEAAIQAFTRMRAMGLEPSIADMTTLVDTTSALGGSADVMNGISRALGQIQTKGKLSAEELNQLAERGVPVYEILRDKLNLTAEAMGNIGKQGISSTTAIAAIMEGLQERFGGQSAKIQQTWGGLTESLKSYWLEFQRLVMDAGVMDWLEAKLGGVVAVLDEMLSSGKLESAAREMAAKVVGALDTLWRRAQEVYRWWQENNREISSGLRGVADTVGQVVAGVREYAGALGNAVSVISGLYLSMKTVVAGNFLVGFFLDSYAASTKLAAGIGMVQGAIASLGAAWALYASYQIGDAIWGVGAEERRQAEAEAETARLRAMVAEKQRAAEAVGGIARQQALTEIGALLDVARADKDALAERLRAKELYHSRLLGQLQQAYAQERGHIEELNALYRQSADLARSTDAMIRELQGVRQSEDQRYYADKEALASQYAAALALQGQEQVKALEEYKQAASRFGREYAQGVSDEAGRVVASGDEVIQAAIRNIQAAAESQQAEIAKLAQAKEEQIRQDREWIGSLERSSAAAVAEINSLKATIGQISEAISRMEKEIAIKGVDLASPVIASIRTALDALHDLARKPVTITTINRQVNQQEGGSARPAALADYVLDSYARGTDYVPRTGLYQLHQGEAVVPAQANQERGRGGGDIIINVPPTAAPMSPDEWRRTTRDHILPELRRAGYGK